MEDSNISVTVKAVTLSDLTEDDPHRASLYSIHLLDYLLFVGGIMLLAVIVLGNLLILMSMRKIMVLHVPTNILIVNLAISDMGVGIFVMPFSLVSFFQLRDHNILYGQKVFCNAVGVLRQMLLCSSTYTIATISYERFLGVRRPMSYKKIVNKKFALTAVGTIWTYSTLYSLVTVAMPDNTVGAYVYNDYTGYCIQQWWFGTDVGETIEVVVNTVLNFVIPFASMGFYYSKVLKALHANLHFCYKMKVPSSFQSKYVRTKRDREINSAWTILIIMVAFVLCWIPFLIQFAMIVLHNFNMGDQMQLYFVTFANVFYFLGCGINPLIYIFRCTRFKKESKRLIFVFLEMVVCCDSNLRDAISARADPKRKKMTPKDYARASMKYYADNARNRRLLEEGLRPRPGNLPRVDSEYNTSALVSYNVEEFESRTQPVESIDDLGGYERLNQTVVVIHTLNNKKPNFTTSRHNRSLQLRSALNRLDEERGTEDDSRSAISLDVDRATTGDSSSTSSRIVGQKRIMRHLNRTLHVISSTLSHQDTMASASSGSVFNKTLNRTSGTPSTPGSSNLFTATSPRSQGRSTPSLWYENVKSPIKASRHVFRGLLAEFQDKTSSTFSFGGLTPRSARVKSDNENLNLNDNAYGGSQARYSAVRWQSQGSDDRRGMSLRLQSFATEDLEDEAFVEVEDVVLCNRNFSPGRISLPDRRENLTRPVGAMTKSQSTGNLGGTSSGNVSHCAYEFDPKIKFNNFVLDSSL